MVPSLEMSLARLGVRVYLVKYGVNAVGGEGVASHDGNRPLYGYAVCCYLLYKPRMCDVMNMVCCCSSYWILYISG
jgi:hypothetical protein